MTQNETPGAREIRKARRVITKTRCAKSKPKHKIDSVTVHHTHLGRLITSLLISQAKLMVRETNIIEHKTDYQLPTGTSLTYRGRCKPVEAIINKQNAYQREHI